MALKRWDVFCKVIDNYGDVGVTWRLARQLAAEHARTVRLWVDDLDSLERLCPDIDPRLDTQRAHGVEVRRWDDAAGSAQPADVVIEAFACELPAAYCASKGGVVNLTRALAVEYIARGVRVNAVAPGGMRTPLTKSFNLPDGASVDDLRTIMSKIGVSQPEEVATCVAYVASDDARYMVGSIVNFDGGLVCYGGGFPQ